MQAASPEDPAVSQVLAQAGAGYQCLIMEVTPGGEFHRVACPAPALFQCAIFCLDISKQKDCCLCHRQRRALWIPVAWQWLLQDASEMHRSSFDVFYLRSVLPVQQQDDHML